MLPSTPSTITIAAAPTPQTSARTSESVLSRLKSFRGQWRLVELEDLEQFAAQFKRQRIKHGRRARRVAVAYWRDLGFTQGDVGVALGRRYGTDFSQTTISRFEALNLSFKNMCKLRPLMQEWMTEAEAAIERGATVADIVAADALRSADDSIESESKPTFSASPLSMSAEGIAKVRNYFGCRRRIFLPLPPHASRSLAAADERFRSARKSQPPFVRRRARSSLSAVACSTLGEDLHFERVSAVAPFGCYARRFYLPLPRSPPPPPSPLPPSPPPSSSRLPLSNGSLRVNGKQNSCQRRVAAARASDALQKTLIDRACRSKSSSSSNAHRQATFEQLSDFLRRVAALPYIDNADNPVASIFSPPRRRRAASLRARPIRDGNRRAQRAAAPLRRRRSLWRRFRRWLHRKLATPHDRDLGGNCRLRSARTA